MTVDKERYEKTVKEAKNDFVVKVVAHVILAIAAIVIAVLNITKPATVIICAVALIWIIVSLVINVKKSMPKVIYSKEYSGKIVKVFINSGERPGENATKAELYVATAPGCVEVATGLTNAAAKVYQAGDEVFHIAGTRCPIITSRDTDVIPCPICATVHTNRTQKCPTCKR